MKFSTKIIHSGQRLDPYTGALTTPIYQSSIFARQTTTKFQKDNEFVTGNPTTVALEENIASVEDGRYALAFSSGCSVSNSIMNLLSAGDHVVANNTLYGNMYDLFDKVYHQYGINFTFVDISNISAIEKVIQQNTRLLWLETIDNTLIKVADLKELANFAKEHNLVSVVDNTVATPYLVNPLTYGFDIVIHRTINYLGGHGDSIGGILVTNKKELIDRLSFYQRSVGVPLSPFESWLLLRGIKTLPLRMKAHCDNALQIAGFLKYNDNVTKVYYPGLEEDKHHNIAKEQLKHYGGILSFELKGGLKVAQTFLNSTRLFFTTESFGGVSSLISHPSTMSHSNLSLEDKERLEISDGLIRLSVGIEDIEDLIQDLKRAFENINF